jgi:hypothetical protein
MREFARDFSTAFGAEVEPANGDELFIRLPPNLAQHFGKTELHLVFSAVEMSPYEDLVAYGSRMFEQMVAWLDGRGEMTILELPARSAGATETEQRTLPADLSLHNVTADAESRPSREAYVRFDLCLTYTADDRQDELLTLVLDQLGTLHPELAHPYPGAIEWQDDALPLSVDVCERLAKVAVDLARVHADERVAQMERDLRPRLHRTLLRLSTFYSRRMDELDPEDENTPLVRQQLAEELERKTADELVRQQVRVTISPVSWAMLSVPEMRWRLTLRRPGGLAVPVLVRQNLHDDTTSPIHCHACTEPTTCLGVCDHGHIACPDCLHTCVVCDQDVCTACGVQRGHISGEWVCAQCAVTCSACGHLAIPRNTAPCAVCGQRVCHACSHECPHCGKRFCQEHTVSCAICGAKRCTEQGLICHVCERPTCESHHLLCPVCGQGCCTHHTATCALCAQSVCSECLHETGLCDTCVSALTGKQVPQPGALDGLPWASRYAWRAGQNNACTVYYGEHRWGKRRLWAVVVIDSEGKLCHQYRVSLGRALMDGWRGVAPPSTQVGLAGSVSGAEKH